MLRLDLSPIDYGILVIYFLVVLGIGFIARLTIKTDLDFFLSGRSLPAWITGLAFIAANLGALEILGQAANGAQYGVAAVHYYWIGAVPAMVFLGIVMMPFYYGAKVRSVPEYLRLRFNEATACICRPPGSSPDATAGSIWSDPHFRNSSARVQRRHVRGGHGAHLWGQPGPRAHHPPDAGLVGVDRDPRGGRGRAGLHRSGTSSRSGNRACTPGRACASGT